MSKKSKYILEEAEILDFAAEGKCIIKNEGEVIFVDGGNICPGDKVKVLVSKSKKKYAEGRILNIVSKSSERIEPFCEHFGVCGGCKWQHILYHTQLIQKQKQVLDQLQRIGKVDTSIAKNILGSENTQYYRNKLEFTFSNSKWFLDSEDTENNALGFHIPKRFDKILHINGCYLNPDPSNQFLNFFQKYAKESGMLFYDHVAHVGFFRTLMIRITSIGETMILVQFAQNNKEAISKCMEAVLDVFPGISSLNYTINTKRNDTFFDLEIINVSGKPYIEEKMGELTFRIGPKSFYQTNSKQAHRLYQEVADLAQIQKSDIVYDLYTGTGTIANFVAKYASKVVGIEYIEDAVKDAVKNSVLNQIENTSFFYGDMSKVFTEEFISSNGKPDIVITDPPRAGMDKAVVEVLNRILPKKIVYVSCNAATQARDVELLSENYQVAAIQPVDMFPHTFHVENIVLLILKG